MLLCRSAWQRLAPLTQRGTAALRRNAPAREMSGSAAAGTSWYDLRYYLLVIGVASVGTAVATYRILQNAKARDRQRLEFQEKRKAQWAAYNASKHGEALETSALTKTIVEAVEAAMEEAVAEEIVEQEVAPISALEQEQPVAEVDAPAAPTEEEPFMSTEASAEQVDEETVELVAEAIAAETSPVSETSSESIVEEVASEDWSELSCHKPEEAGEDRSPAEQESEEAVESEEISSSS